jgi:hypothetical protein
MFEPIPFEEREEHSLIGEIEPLKETAEAKARRVWKMEPKDETQED